VANPEHMAILKQGVRAWNSWRAEHRDVTPDLAGADLAEAELAQAHLFRADLSRAELSLANLAGASLQNANLHMARLSSARLALANLEGASCKGANLARARLYDASLYRTDLSGADCRNTDFRRTRLVRGCAHAARFDSAVFGWTIIASVDLSGALGLETVSHTGPTFVDLHTIHFSEGRIPDAFLRGAGTPEHFITYLRTTVERPTDFCSCFISYSDKDCDFAQRLHKDLQARGVRCWLSISDLQPGDKQLDEIYTQIDQRDRVIVIVSENSIASGWVEDEVSRAFAVERTRAPGVVLPIRIDDAVMTTKKAWAVKLRDQVNIGDFREWKSPGPYTAELERLIAKLQRN
jgi:uncharacterized protein YjbI with pentapeptide repeats